MALDTGDDVLVWTWAAVGRPTCSVVDAAEGRPVELTTATNGPRRPGGSAGNYVGTWTFESPGDVLVTCAGLPEDASSLGSVYVERAPVLLGSLGHIATVPLLLTVAGLAAALAAVISARRRAGSTET